VGAAVAAGVLAGCGESEPPRQSAGGLTAGDFDRVAYEDAIAVGEVAVSARLTSPTNDGKGDVRVEIDRRPSLMTIRLAVWISRESGQFAFELIEVGDETFFRPGTSNDDGEWIFADRKDAGTDAPRVESIAAAFPVVGEIVRSVRAAGWAEQGAEPCPSTGNCFVFTNPGFEFASLYVDSQSYRPVHIRLARPGMRAAGEIEIDWMATTAVETPSNARLVGAVEFQKALGPVLQTLGL
jgi:hypothetical protein